jgi:hypothetical protein
MRKVAHERTHERTHERWTVLASLSTTSSMDGLRLLEEALRAPPHTKDLAFEVVHAFVAFWGANEDRRRAFAADQGVRADPLAAVKRLTNDRRRQRTPPPPTTTTTTTTIHSSSSSSSSSRFYVDEQQALTLPVLFCPRFWRSCVCAVFVCVRVCVVCGMAHVVVPLCGSGGGALAVLRRARRSRGTPTRHRLRTRPLRSTPEPPPGRKSSLAFVLSRHPPACPTVACTGLTTCVLMRAPSP